MSRTDYGDDRLAKLGARVATAEDIDGLTATLTAAFANDPVWSWALPDQRGLAAWWRLLIGSALRHRWVWTIDDYAAAAVWIPPGCVELTEAEGAQVKPMLQQLVGPRAGEVLDLVERFDATHPAGPPHYYLSLLGTHPSHRGRGLGMALLAHNLTTIDAERMPAYLESTNGANDKRYEAQGFRRFGSFSRPDGQLTISTMWRDPLTPATTGNF
jgi:GNAT superfamily N-acetyltransferase